MDDTYNSHSQLRSLETGASSGTTAKAAADGRRAKYALPLAIILTALTTAVIVTAAGAAAVTGHVKRLDPAVRGAAPPPPKKGAGGGGLPPAPHAPPYRFFAIGDWGRRGVLNQTRVAAAMARRAAATAAAGSPVSVIISTGDNFYPWGLVSDDDPAFDASFTAVYNDPALADIPWHGTLGNHDYAPVDGPRAEAAGGGPLVPTPEECAGAAGAPGAGCQYGPLPELGARVRRRDGRWHVGRGYTFTPPPTSAAPAIGGLDFFFFDTSPAVEAYREEAWAANPGGLAEQSPAANLAELGAAMAASTAKWKLVVAHHPPSGLRVPSRTPGLDAELCPVAEEGGAAAIISGHEHLLAYIAEPAGPCSSLPQITSGSGGAVDSKPFAPNPAKAVTAGTDWWQGLESGFVECAVSEEAMACDFWGTVEGAPPLYSAVVKPPKK